MADKNIIYLGNEKIKLTKRGRELLQEISLSKINIEMKDEWDEIWHLVSYDIPKTHNKERDILRDFLKRNDFYQIQASLWALPFECKEEVAVVSKHLRILDFVILMTTNHLPDQAKMEEYYNL